MAKLSAEKLNKKSEKAFDVRDANRNLYVDCYEIYCPYRNTLTQQGNSFNSPTRQYSSTSQISAASFVNTIQREFTPPFTMWSLLKAGAGVPKEAQAELNTKLEEISEIFFGYLNASNFATASTEMYFEWGIGTGCLWFYEGDEQNPFNFVSSPISEMGILEAPNGKVDYRCRKRPVKNNEIKILWPQAKLPDDIDLKSEKETDVIEHFYYDYQDLIWRYAVTIKDECIFDTTHSEEICFTPRWAKLPNNPMGYGVFLMALADAKTENKLKEFLLRSAALDCAGVYTVTSDGALNPNTLNLAPNTFIPVERNSGENGATIARLDTTANFQLQEYILNGLQDSIKKTLLDNRLPAETPQPKTAFEIAQRMREFQTDIGTAYGRGYFEFIQPLWKRGLSILARRGLIDLPEGFTIDNFFISINVVSPIAQTQQAEEVQRFMQQYQMVAMIDPNLAKTAYTVEDLPKWLTSMMGTPSKLLRNEVEAKQLQQQMAATAMQMEQLANAKPA